MQVYNRHHANRVTTLSPARELPIQKGFQTSLVTLHSAKSAADLLYSIALLANQSLVIM